MMRLVPTEWGKKTSVGVQGLVPATRRGMKKQTQHKPTRGKFSLLRQLGNLLPNPLLPQLAREHAVEKKSRTFRPWSRVVCLLHAQLTHALCLNNGCEALRLHSGLLSGIRGATLTLLRFCGEGFRGRKAIWNRQVKRAGATTPSSSKMPWLWCNPDAPSGRVFSLHPPSLPPGCRHGGNRCAKKPRGPLHSSTGTSSRSCRISAFRTRRGAPRTGRGIRFRAGRAG